MVKRVSFLQILLSVFVQICHGAESASLDFLHVLKCSLQLAPSLSLPLDWPCATPYGTSPPKTQTQLLSRRKKRKPLSCNACCTRRRKAGPGALYDFTLGKRPCLNLVQEVEMCLICLVKLNPAFSLEF